MKVLLLSERTSPTEKMAIAVRLDKDIVSQGKDAAQALERLQKTSLGYEAIEERNRREGKPVQEHKPPPLVYARIYGISAFWDGKAPKEWQVRIWHGESPVQWSVSKRFRNRS